MGATRMTDYFSGWLTTASHEEVKENTIGGLVMGAGAGAIVLTGGAVLEYGPSVLTWSLTHPIASSQIAVHGTSFFVGVMDPSPPGQIDIVPASPGDEIGKLFKFTVTKLLSRFTAVELATKKLYRSVSIGEFEDIVSSGGQLRPATVEMNGTIYPTGYQGKLFAEKLEDAIREGEALYGAKGEEYKLIEVEVTESFFSKMSKHPEIDNGIGVTTTVSADYEQMAELNSNTLSIGEVTKTEIE